MQDAMPREETCETQKRGGVTLALEPLLVEAVQQRAAVVTEGGAAVAVGAELVHSGPRLPVPAVLDSADSAVLLLQLWK